MSVYFAKGHQEGLVKIGKSDSPEKRIAALARAEGQMVTMLRVIDGGHAVEREMHQTFSALRVRGEWFRFDQSMMSVEASREAKQKDVDRQNDRAAAQAESDRQLKLLMSRRAALAALRGAIKQEGSERINSALADVEAALGREITACAWWAAPYLALGATP